MIKMDRTTIAAIATPGGSGGIGIVKISGSRSLGIAAKIFHPAGLKELNRADHADSNLWQPESHRLYYGHVVDPNTGGIVDEVLLTALKSPRSHTREDVVEISAHGSSLVLHTILQLVIRHGARLAEPGEFTRRAFLNGRIDLTQAEAVIDLINAKSMQARKIAANQIAGNLRNAIETVRSALIDRIVTIEAGIDFPDEVEESIDCGSFRQQLIDDVVVPLKSLQKNYRDARLLRDGITLLIVGQPNVGKSSLLNRLVQKERAIVTDIPGTTRDFIEERFHLNGTAVNVIDTAGFQETDDPIESIGIRKTLELIHDADAILFVVDITRPINIDDEKIFSLVAEKNLIIVLNKRDLLQEKAINRLPKKWKGTVCIDVSAKTGDKVDELKALIERSCLPGAETGLEDEIVPNLRQAVQLDKAIQQTGQAALALAQGLPFELIAIDLQGALEALDESLGRILKEDILETIFSRFCIGK